MDKDIKSLLKIIGICFISEIILIILLIALFCSIDVYSCYNTGGYWVFNKIDEKVCLDLGVENCAENPRCSLYATISEGGFSPVCKPEHGCKCPKTSNSWYGGLRGCQ